MATDALLKPLQCAGRLVYPMDLFSDGFETGDTTMWSGTTP